MSSSKSKQVEDGVADRVLMVDDDPVVNRAMTLLMTRGGLSPVACTTGEQAMALAAALPIAAVVVDIHLPDINGLDLSHTLREKLGPAVPIVVLSGDNSMDTLRALPQAGATHFFAKPVNAAMLIERLKQWMGRAGASPLQAV